MDEKKSVVIRSLVVERAVEVDGSSDGDSGGCVVIVDLRVDVTPIVNVTVVLSAPVVAVGYSVVVTSSTMVVVNGATVVSAFVVVTVVGEISTVTSSGVVDIADGANVVVGASVDSSSPVAGLSVVAGSVLTASMVVVRSGEKVVDDGAVAGDDRSRVVAGSVLCSAADEDAGYDVLSGAVEASVVVGSPEELLSA